MRLPDDPKKFTSKWRYVEIARWRPDKEGVWKVMRELRNSKPVILEWADVEEYRKKNNNLGLYTSVWNYDNRDLDKTTRLGPLYFDLDSDEPSRSLEDAVRLVSYLADFIPEPGIRVYFTGKKGFHIECEPIPLGVSPSNELPGLFRYIATELTKQLNLSTIDSVVYEPRRMWRLPNSEHQLTGLFKVDLGVAGLLEWSLDQILEYAREPHWDEVPEQEFNAKANEWYREWGYKEYEARTLTIQDRIERFNKLGSTVLRKVGEGELVFDPKSLLENCHAINDLWTKAERTHDLTHEERLFLCSILTYTEDSQQYLHAILRNCDDYNEIKSQSHIDDWIRRREMNIGGRPYSCDRANSAGVGCGDCHLEPKERIAKVGNSWVATGEMAQPSPIRYGYYKKKEV